MTTLAPERIRPGARFAYGIDSGEGCLVAPGDTVRITVAPPDAHRPLGVYTSPEGAASFEPVGAWVGICAIELSRVAPPPQLAPGLPYWAIVPAWEVPPYVPVSLEVRSTADKCMRATFSMWAMAVAPFDGPPRLRDRERPRLPLRRRRH